MTIKVLFFASLSEQLGQRQTELLWQAGQNVADVWRLSTQRDLPTTTLLAARNQTYCDLQTLVADGDEIAFFPPVTGG